MRKFFFVLMMVCVIPLLSSDANSETFYSRGTITEKNVSMEIRGAFAFWDSGSREDRKYLKLYLLSYKETKQDIAAGKAEIPAFFKRSEGLPSPDKSKWQWCPYAYLRYEFETSSKEIQLDALRYLWLHFQGFSAKYSSYDITLPDWDPALQKEQVKFRIIKGKDYDTLEMTMKGERISGDKSAHSWDFAIKTRIY